ncbi:unnamed protein product [Lepeophtheirus salmonis]|uniref:(salmon louse) hypothetical protein n=1 Tax=Lepeophtheirus salmonis TaxID=72036 RepID=A0A7R8CPS7_LEPSM|nr:unnamed protein product [Lepeophtheirus salmonis]CAF2886116.1 unnamed protein product [Lepeophtheirus salmonis]
MLREQCLLIPSTYKHSIDEVIVVYKGTRAGPLRQYIANKADKWGFKLFNRASSCGIIHDLLMYQELTKKGRGALDYSNAYGIELLSTVQQWSKEDHAKIKVSCPSLLPAYHEHMGGIDRLTCWFNCTRPQQSQGVVYRRDCALLDEKPMPLKKFPLAVAHSLKPANKPAFKVGRPSTSSHQIYLRRNYMPQDPHNTNQMCGLMSVGICHSTMTSEDDATHIQRVCPDGNVKST